MLFEHTHARSHARAHIARASLVRTRPKYATQASCLSSAVAYRVPLMPAFRRVRLSGLTPGGVILAPCVTSCDRVDEREPSSCYDCASFAPRAAPWWRAGSIKLHFYRLRVTTNRQRFAILTRSETTCDRLYPLSRCLRLSLFGISTRRDRRKKFNAWLFIVLALFSFFFRSFFTWQALLEIEDRSARNVAIGKSTHAHRKKMRQGRLK